MDLIFTSTTLKKDSTKQNLLEDSVGNHLKFSRLMNLGCFLTNN